MGLMKPLFDYTKIFTEKDVKEFFAERSKEDFEIENLPPKKKPVNTYLKTKYFEYLGRKNKQSRDFGKIDGRYLRNVLLFRYDAIGDYVVTSPIIRYLKENNPEVNIDVITSYRNDHMIRRDPYIRYTQPVHPSKNFMFSWKPAIDWGKKNDYNLVLGLVFTYMTKSALFATSIAPGAQKLTVAHDKRREIYGNVFNRQTDHLVWKEHWIDTMIRAGIQNISFPGGVKPGSTNPYIFIYDEDLRSIMPLLQQHNLNFRLRMDNLLLPDATADYNRPGYPYCILNMDAFSANRKLSTESAAAICRVFIEKYRDLRVFVSGGPKIRKEIEETVQKVSHPHCLPLRLSLNGFIAFTAGADFLISPDTGPVHIAAAAGVPVLGLYAELIKVAEWYPYNTRFIILLSKDPWTINAIEPEKVLDAAGMLYNM